MNDPMSNTDNGAGTTQHAETPPNAFPGLDLQRLRLAKGSEVAVTKRLVVTVPVRKPNRQEFVRVHPDPEWRLQTATLTTQDDRKTYLVEPSLWEALAGDLVPTMIVTAITRQGVIFLWPLRLPSTDGRASDWHTSAIEAAKLGESTWVKVVSNMNLGAYELHGATGELGEPTWPDLSFKRLVEIAFRDGFIQNDDHPILRRLRGEL